MSEMMITALLLSLAVLIEVLESFKPHLHLHEQFFLDKFALTRKNCS